MLAQARARPEALVIGVDALAGVMAQASRRASAKPSRGGLANAMFLAAAAEALPGPLAGAADEITLNYPWASLLRALARPDGDLLKRLASLGKPGARFRAMVNVRPLRDAGHAEKLGLAGSALLHDPGVLAAGYAQAGLVGLRASQVRDPPETSWGKHLAASKREIWRLEAEVR